MKFLPGVLTLIAVFPAMAEISTYDRHVIFDNSLPDVSYDNTESYLVAPSTLETYDAKFPVDQTHFGI